MTLKKEQRRTQKIPFQAKATAAKAAASGGDSRKARKGMETKSDRVTPDAAHLRVISAASSQVLMSARPAAKYRTAISHYKVTLF